MAVAGGLPIVKVPPIHVVYNVIQSMNYGHGRMASMQRRTRGLRVLLVMSIV